MQSLPHRYPALQQESADLIDNAGALTDQSLAHPMQRLQVELVGGLRCNKFHRRALHCLDGRTYFAGISRASWPSACSLRLR